MLGLNESEDIGVNYQISASHLFWITMEALGSREALPHYEADQLRELGWAMGVSGKEAIARNPAIIKQCRRIFRRQASERAFQYVISLITDLG